MSGFCRWYEKDMEDITEHEQEQCEENGQDCRECPDLMIKEQEAAGHERHQYRFLNYSGELVRLDVP